jgi:hypothetical protein
MGTLTITPTISHKWEDREGMLLSLSKEFDYSPPDYISAKLKVKKLRSELPKNSNDDIQAPLTKDELSRLRFHKNYLPQLGERWGRGIGLYREALPSKPRNMFLNYLKTEIRPEEFKSSYALMTALKTMGNYYKGNAIPGWEYVEGAERLGGYMNLPEDDSFNEEVRHWVSHKPKPKFFEDDYKKAVREIIDELSQQRDVEYISPKDWVETRENWMTPGSIDLKLGEYEGRKIPKTKTAAAYFLTDRQLRDLLYKEGPGLNKAVPKRELSKVRAIIAGDFPTYLKMGYLSHWIEEDMRGSDLMTLTMNSDQLMNMWYELSKTLPQLAMPLDQSNFDQNLSAWMVIETILALKEYYAVRFPFLSKWFDKLLYSIKHALIKLPDGELLKWEGGVLSGWRWTSLITSIINLAQVRSASNRWQSLGNTDPILRVVAQGDDDEIRLNSRTFVDFMLNYYNISGFEANPSKIFVDTERDDFLRRIIKENSVIGPPARAVNSIIWANPSNRTFERGLDRINMTINSWATLYSRGADSQNTIQMMKLDLRRMTKLTAAEINNLLHTPKSVGGMGVFASDPQLPWMDVKYEKTILDDMVVPAPQYLTRFWGVEKDVEPEAVGQWNIKFYQNVAEAREIEKMSAWYISTYNLSIVRQSIYPSWDETVPRLNLDLYIVDLWKENPDKVRSLVVDKGEYDLVFAKCRRSVFLDWLRGDVGFKAPNILNISPDFVNYVYQRIRNQVFRSLLLKRYQIGRKHIRRAALYVERCTREETTELVNKLAWKISS